MYSEFYSLGGVVFKLNSQEELAASKFCAPFRVGECAPDYTINLSFSNVDHAAPKNAARNVSTARWHDERGFCIMQSFDSKYRTFSARRGNSVSVELSHEYRSSVSAMKLLEAAGLFDILADAGMLVLHSSYIRTKNGDGLVFSGPSGTGKSTQAELWSKYADASVVNGDRALICTSKKTANGIIYSGTSGISNNISSPLKAIVMPVQSERNEVRLMRPKEAFMRLINQCAYYPWDAESSNKMTELVSQLVTAVPTYELLCRKDEGAVRALENELRGE